MPPSALLSPRDYVDALGLVALYLPIVVSSWKVTGERAIRVLGVERREGCAPVGVAITGARLLRPAQLLALHARLPPPCRVSERSPSCPRCAVV